MHGAVYLPLYNKRLKNGCHMASGKREIDHFEH